MLGQDYFLAWKGTRNQEEGRASSQRYPNHDTKLPVISEKYEAPNDDGARLFFSSERYEEPNDSEPTSSCNKNALHADGGHRAHSKKNPATHGNLPHVVGLLNPLGRWIQSEIDASGLASVRNPRS